jgi:hypothetical protein
MITAAYVTSLWSRSHGRARFDHLSGNPQNWQKGCRGPSFSHLPPSGVDGRSDVFRAYPPRGQPFSQLATLPCSEEPRTTGHRAGEASSRTSSFRGPQVDAR